MALSSNPARKMTTTGAWVFFNEAVGAASAAQGLAEMRQGRRLKPPLPETWN